MKNEEGVKGDMMDFNSMILHTVYYVRIYCG